MRFGERSIAPPHYLAELARKRRRCDRCRPISCGISGTRFRRSGSAYDAHGPLEAARHFAKVLGQLEAHGAAVVVPALTVALATGTPLLLALTPVRSAPRIAPDVSR
jgi:hypothetical protein